MFYIKYAMCDDTKLYNTILDYTILHDTTLYYTLLHYIIPYAVYC